MRSTIKKSTTYILRLEEREARWLRGLMQNPIVKENLPLNEDKTDREMRELYFNALTKKG